jgi:hypothetical protein
MNIAWHDLLGTIGVALVLWAYFALQTGRLKAEHVSYSVFNGIGAAFVVVSLLFEFNLSALLMEGAWVLISLIGIWKWLKAKRRA